MSFSFNAAPRVIRSKRKYREAKLFDTTKYTPWELEAKYVKEQEEKLKIENMKRQLNNFKKNKKMRPYDIKPSPNPRIPIDLKFFLTDDFYIKKPKMKQTETQTDALIGAGEVTTRVVRRKGIKGDIIEYEPEQLYIPKKVGVDVYSQVENDELFDFNREVQPILNVLVTKTLEQSVLELEEEQEIQNMIEFKKNYVKKKVQKNEDDWKDIIEKEMERIDQKETILGDLTFTFIRENLLKKKVVSHQIACKYLRDLLPESIQSLNNRGFYKNEQLDVFRVDYTQFLIEKVVKVLEEDKVLAQNSNGLFVEIEPNLKKMRNPADLKKQEYTEKTSRPLVYSKKEERKIYIYNKQTANNCPLVFSCFLSMVWANSYTEYEEDMTTKFLEIKDRFETGNLTQEEYDEAIINELPNPALEVFSAKFDNIDKLHFSFTNNPFQKLLKQDRNFRAGVCFYNEEAEEIERLSSLSRKGNMGTWYDGDDFKYHGLEKEEEIIELDIQQMKTHKATYALVYLYASDFDSKMKNLEEMKIVQYRLFNRDTGINFFKGRFEKSLDSLFLINPEEGIKEEAEDERSCIVGCFLVYFDEGKGWGFDHLKSFGVGYQSLNQYLKKASKHIATMHHRGNLTELVKYWEKVHEEKILAEKTEREMQEEISTLKEEDKNSRSAEVEVEEEEIVEEKSVVVQEASVSIAGGNNYMLDSGNSFIGPITLNFKEDDYEALINNVTTYLEESNKKLAEELPSGFDLLLRKRDISEDITGLKSIKDYRELRLDKIIPVEEEAGEEEDGEEENEEDSD